MPSQRDDFSTEATSADLTAAGRLAREDQPETDPFAAVATDPLDVGAATQAQSLAGPPAAAQQRNGSPVLTVALLTGVLAVAFESYGTLTAMPVASRELGNLELYAWTATAFAIANVFSIIAAGRLADRSGPRLPLIGGMLIFIVGLLIAGLAPNMAVLLFGRAVQGLGGGAVSVALMLVIALAYHGRKRADLMGWFSFCWVLPAFLGPPIAAWITEQISWHWVFLGVIPVIALSGGLALGPLLKLPPVAAQVDGSAKPIALSAAALVAAAVAGLQVAGQRLDLIALPIAVLAVAALVWMFPKLMPAGFNRAASGLPAAAAARLFVTGGFFAAENFLTLLLLERYGLELTRAGLFLILGSLGWTVGSFLQARSFVTIGRERLVQIGALALAVGNLLVALAALWKASLWLVALGFVIAGLGTGLVTSVVSLANMLLSPAGELGRNTSSLQVCDATGNALITGLAGTIFVALHHAPGGAEFVAIYLMASLIAGLGWLLARRIGPLPDFSQAG